MTCVQGGLQTCSAVGGLAMDLVFLYGAPSVGKLTIATEIAQRTGFRLFDNHVSVDFALAIFERGTRPYARLLKTSRLVAIEAAARADVSVIFTFVYAFPNDDPFLRRLFHAVERHSGRVCPVRLVCEDAVAELRVADAQRVRRQKLVSVAALRHYRQVYDMSRAIPHKQSLVLDTGQLLPTEAAQRIITHFGLPTIA
jgi:hypothetical protein